MTSDPDRAESGGKIHDRRPRRSRFLALAAGVCLAGGLAAQEPDWRPLRRAADSALGAGDYATYRARLGDLYALFPGDPRLTWSLARADALLGSREAALGWLRRFADMGLVSDVAADSGLASLRDDPGLTPIAERLERNRRPVLQAETAFPLPAGDLIAEDIAYDPLRRRFFVSSVRLGRILTVEANGAAGDFVQAARPGWAMLALVADPQRRRLWATTAAMPAASGYTAADSGRTALLAFDLDDGQLLERIDRAPDGAGHELGDLSLLPDGGVLVTDSRSGDLLRVRPGTRRLEVVVPPGTFVSPQQPAVEPGARRAFVPDYARGIAAVDLVSGAVTWLARAEDVAATGIDGLVLRGGELLACQNGVVPERVVRLQLDSTRSRLERWSPIESGTPALGEPTHGVVVNDAFYYIANSGWDHLDDHGQAPPGVALTPPLVRRADLGPPR